MLFYWIDRIISGDTLFGLSIYGACLLAYLLAGLARWPRWVRGVYFGLLAFGLMVIMHMAVDQLQNWYVTPLAPHMQIIR